MTELQLTDAGRRLRTECKLGTHISIGRAFFTRCQVAQGSVCKCQKWVTGLGAVL